MSSLKNGKHSDAILTPGAEPGAITCFLTHTGETQLLKSVTKGTKLREDHVHLSPLWPLQDPFFLTEKENLSYFTVAALTGLRFGRFRSV